MNEAVTERSPHIAVVIPTFNEPDLVVACLRSLESLGVSHEVIVANAGEAIPDLNPSVTQLQLPSDHFWAASTQAGIDRALESGADYVVLANADTEFMPGTLAALLEATQSNAQAIACVPAYDESEHLLYSRQDSWGFLLYGKLVRGWSSPSDAPSAPYRTDLIGGQGVMIPAAALRAARMDLENFPQYAADHDFWLQLAQRGWELWVTPRGGVRNRRGFNRQRRRSLASTLWHRMTSPFAPESIPIMWRLRRKHLPLPIAVVSFVVSFGLRWTLGLPKIIRRS